MGHPGTAQRALMAFHHILSSKKISTMHAWAQELHLQGILKTGYPGVALLVDRAPNADGNVAEYVRRVKRLPWQTCELRLLEPVACPAMLESLHAAVHGPAQTSRMSRRSGLVELDTLKTITPLLRDADERHAKAHAATQCGDAWEPFYRRAMRP